MEKNSAGRKANSITIALYTKNSKQSIELAHKLIQHTANKKDTRQFLFKEAEISRPYGKKTDIAFIIGHKDDSEVIMLKKLLEKKDQDYIMINKISSAPETLTDLEKALDLGFTVEDFAQINLHGVSIENIITQLSTFRNSIPKITLEKPAVINDGIYSLDKSRAEDYAGFFNSKKENLTLKKFVPASGAATRMFKFLSEFMASYNPENESINAYMNKRKSSSMKVFLIGMEKFPFYEDVLKELKKNPNYEDWIRDQRNYNFIKLMLSDGPFDFANKPKAILPFHKYQDLTATPIYEHLKESAAYAASNEETHVHFTISQEHLDGFLDAIKDVKEPIEKESGVQISVDFSYQHKETDTIAVDMNNMPFRNSDGTLLFRPGGHGALIENLNELEADIVFIKNIDNVSHNNIHTIALYKKALAGVLIKTQEQIFEYLQKIEHNTISSDETEEILKFASQKLCIDIPQDISKYTSENKKEYITQVLNRPVRVCGMVKNEGEPGGGPFWVKSHNGRLSLQIVESSQIDLENKFQENIFSQSTHFNPVDLVCGLKNYKGERFDLREFIDPSTGFIVHKTRFGKDLKSYELPGLWNGAMAEWITLFVEVPLDTFNPVKNVNDLLKPAHQSQEL